MSLIEGGGGIRKHDHNPQARPEPRRTNTSQGIHPRTLEQRLERLKMRQQDQSQQRIPTRDEKQDPVASAVHAELAHPPRLRHPPRLPPPPPAAQEQQQHQQQQTNQRGEQRGVRFGSGAAVSAERSFGLAPAFRPVGGSAAMHAPIGAPLSHERSVTEEPGAQTQNNQARPAARPSAGYGAGGEEQYKHEESSDSCDDEQEDEDEDGGE